MRLLQLLLVNKKAMVMLVAICLIIIIIGIFKKPAVVEQVVTVRVLESALSPYFLPQYLALNLGFFKEQNLQVNITTTSQEAIRAALADGRTDIVLCGLQKIIFNPNARGSQPKVFATMAGKDGSLLLDRNNSEEFQWQNMKNKTIIGNSHDDSSEIALEEALRQNSMPPYRKVTIYNNIPVKLRLGAFRSGTGHYIQMLEPDATLAEFKGYGQVVASVGEATGNMVVTAYACLPEYMEANAQTIQRFTNAVYKAQLWLSQHSPEEAAAAAAPSFPNLDLEILLHSIERYRALGVWTENPIVNREHYEKFNTAAKNAGEILNPMPYETVVVSDFATCAVETVIYIREETKRDKKSLFNIFRLRDS